MKDQKGVEIVPGCRVKMLSKGYTYLGTVVDTQPATEGDDFDRGSFWDHFDMVKIEDWESARHGFPWQFASSLEVIS